MKYPFDAAIEELEANIEEFVDAVFESLESEFLVMPRGDGFVDYPTFEDGFQALKQATESKVLRPQRATAGDRSRPGPCTINN